MGDPVAIRTDPNPCHRYRWPEHPACPDAYSGAHLCKYPGGHDGTCVCAGCGKRGRGKDRADNASDTPLDTARDAWEAHHLACPGSVGTWDCVRRANAAGIRVIVVPAR